MHAPSPIQISKSTAQNSPQTPITLLSAPILPQVLTSFPVLVLNGAVMSILSLNSISIGPGTTSSPSLSITCFLPSIAGFGFSILAIGFASNTICARGVNSSNFVSACASDTFSDFIRYSTILSESIVFLRSVSIIIFAKWSAFFL